MISFKNGNNFINNIFTLSKLIICYIYDMEKIFKKTIQFYLVASIILLISVFNEPYEVNEINETISSGILDNNVFIDLFYVILTVVYLIGYYVSLYFVYNFKKVGRKLYVITCVVGLVLSLLSGPIAAGSISLFFNTIVTAFNGAIIVFLFFTSVAKKFN